MADRVARPPTAPATGRSQLRSVHAEFESGVVALEEARERDRLLDDGEAPVVCPFKGLASFDADDAQYFFGREKLVAELVARLVGAHLLGVVGSSGSGKSSVVKAGLLPALASGVLPGSERRAHVITRPGGHPARALQEAMATVADGQQVVVTIDQFEETFTTCEDEDERVAFVDALTRMAGQQDGRCVVVIALRAECYERCAAYPVLAGQLAANHVLVGAMQRDELRRSIERPARRVGLLVDPELTDALVADVDDEPGALPLLNGAARAVAAPRRQALRHSIYERTGGVRGAVARLAEDALGQLDHRQQLLARGVFLRLAGEGASGGVERRRVAREEPMGRAMASLGPIVLLIVLVPLLLACVLVAAALWSIAQLLAELRSAHGRRVAGRAPLHPAVREPAEPAVGVGRAR